VSKAFSHRTARALALVACAVALPACASLWGHRVHLPQGDALRGREAFVDLRCQVCHEIEGFDPPAPIVAARRVRLGGQTARIKTYEDLVTSIANPSHRLASGYPPKDVAIDGEALMSLIRLNEVMTVQQLVDLAAFLQTEYDVVPPPVRLQDVYELEDAETLPGAPAL
jgi:sulfur-oxidizing protein SoxX